MYYYLVSLSNKVFTVLRSSSESEYEEIKRFQEPLSYLLSNNRRFEPLERSYKRISKINKALMLKNDEYNSGDLSDAISGYLFALRKFLDNWETHIKREYGDKSPLLDIFKTATSRAYDNHIEYNIIYQLRNMDQHCDNILSSISIGIEDDGTRYIQAMADCERLLTLFSGWKAHERNHLQQQPKEIDLFNYITITQKCIIQIHQELINYFCTQELYESCLKLIIKSNEYFHERNSLLFLCQENELTKEFWELPKRSLNTTSWLVSESINLISLFLRNNLGVAAILYYGTHPYEKMADFAIELSETDSRNIDIGNIISVNETEYRCHSITRDLLNDSTILVALNIKLAKDQEKQILHSFSSYVYALNGKS